jgi:hypothetical protein
MSAGMELLQKFQVLLKGVRSSLRLLSQAQLARQTVSVTQRSTGDKVKYVQLSGLSY